MSLKSSKITDFVFLYGAIPRGIDFKFVDLKVTFVEYQCLIQLGFLLKIFLFIFHQTEMI